MIAGIQVGKITSVDLEDGHAVVGMDIEPKYLELIHPDATLLLRPKTNLNDMVVEIAPAAARATSKTAHNFPLSQTEPNVNLDAFLATLDADTQQYLQLLLAGGAQGIGGRGRQLSGAFRRLEPFSHYIAKLNRAVAERRVALARVIHDFGLLTTELGRHDREIERFVTSSKDALGNFANQQQLDPGIAGRVPLDADRAALGAGQLRSLHDRRPPGADRPDPAGAGAGAGLQGRPSASSSRPRRRSATRSGPSPARSARCSSTPTKASLRPEEDRQQLRQRARRPQQLPQRARLQAEGLAAELPLLPALAEPRPQRQLQPPGRRRAGPARPGPDLLQRRLPRPVGDRR